MRRLCLATILVFVTARAEALPFLPDFATVTPNSMVFSPTGTNMVLFRDDADPFNDIRAQISLGPATGVPYDPVAVPEPATLLLLGSGIVVGAIAIRRLTVKPRRRRRHR